MGSALIHALVGAGLHVDSNQHLAHGSEMAQEMVIYPCHS